MTAEQTWTPGERAQVEELTATWKRSGFKAWGERAMYYLVAELRAVEAERDAALAQLEEARRAIIHVRAMNPKSTLEHTQNVLLEALARIDALAAQEPRA